MAEQTAREVIEGYTDCNKAIGTGYEVLSWLEELRGPDCRFSCEEWLEVRLNLIKIGLGYYPDGNALLMNGFEVSVLQGNGQEALRFLRLAESANGGFTIMKLNVLKSEKISVGTRKISLIKEAYELRDRELTDTIHELMQDDRKTRILDMVKTNLLMTILFVGISSTIFAGNLNSNMKLSNLNMKLSNLVITPNLVQKSFETVVVLERSPIKGGTDFGKAKRGGIGTDFGIINSRKHNERGVGTDFGLA